MMPPTPAGVTWALVAVCLVLFAASLWSAWQLAGRASALRFAAVALLVGWFAEQMGASRGWFFGQYHYTDVLGPRLGDVPVVIALMWFGLTWLGYVLASLILWRTPLPPASGHWTPRLLTAWLAAMIVTAFDLGADPYFVYVLRAWIMARTDGGWFGETLQGFVGWMVVAGAIVLAFEWVRTPRQSTAPHGPNETAAPLAPLLMYASGLVFQLLFGHPVEIRAVAFFAMGLPLFVAAVAYHGWRQRTRKAVQ